MAIKKIINSKIGIPIEYWRVGKITIDWTNKTCEVELLGYVDQQTRLAGADFVEPPKRFTFIEGEGFDFDPESNLTEDCYNKIKLKPEFEGSEDLL